MTSSAEDIKSAVHAAIPLSRALQFHIESIDENGIVVTAPLEPNINMHGSAFAGSIYSLAALTAWSFVTHLCSTVGEKSSVVIGKAEIFYNKPILEMVQCKSTISREHREAFVRAYSEKGKSKVHLDVAIGRHSEATLKAIVFASSA